MFNQGGNESIMSLGSATESIPFPSPIGIIRTPTQRHTSIEGGRIQPTPMTSAFIPRLARVQSAIAQTFIWNLVRNARKSANGDQELATVLVRKWLNHFLGTRLGNSFFAVAFPYDPSPVTPSFVVRDALPKPPLADGSFNLSRSREPSALISLFTREDEI